MVQSDVVIEVKYFLPKKERKKKERKTKKRKKNKGKKRKTKRERENGLLFRCLVKVWWSRTRNRRVHILSANF